jgi:alanine racemase
MLHLGADVVDLRAVRAGDAVGYRATPCPVDGTLVMIAAGTAQGVLPLPDGRSPFHFARHRLALVEAPHMHTSIAIVPRSDPAPEVGDVVDVQRPLTLSLVDRVVER